MLALMVSFLSGILLESLYVEPFINMDALQARADIYISTEKKKSKARKRLKVLTTTPISNDLSFKERCVSKYENYTPEY